MNNSKPKPSTRHTKTLLYSSTILKADPSLNPLDIRLAIVSMVDCEIEEGINRFKISDEKGLRYYKVLKQFNEDVYKERNKT